MSEQLNFVSFEEAMQALREGKQVSLYGADGMLKRADSINSTQPLRTIAHGIISFSGLFEGKYIIEEETK